MAHLKTHFVRLSKLDKNSSFGKALGTRLISKMHRFPVLNVPNAK